MTKEADAKRILLLEPGIDVEIYPNPLHFVRGILQRPISSLTCAPEGFNGIKFSLFHFGGLPTLDDGDALAGMDLVGANVVAAQVATGLDLVHLAVNLALIRLHHLLDGSSDVAQSDVNASLLDTCEDVSV